MKFFRICLILLMLPLLTSFADHKFYVSITKMEYVKEKQAIQIISKIFIDDIEDVLQQRYDPSISLATKKESRRDIDFLKTYIDQKFDIWVNGQEVTIDFIGHEYETDVLKIYMEVTGVKELKTLEVNNEWLTELFEEQQNIIHFKSDTRRSMILEKENPKGMLNFN